MRFAKLFRKNELILFSPLLTEAEKENINTSTMEGEMQLALLASLSQNEVESISQNVKMGVKMKM
ncbi:hypothetical protein, partial [Anaeromusa sp.]|uniref:hypothetical protein n=1 Tax=Anaeromusa sp. TaxID=1872520 RepID=UPI0026089191